MALRGVEADLPARVAQLEAKFRALEAKSNVRPRDTRFLYSARGDILMAVGPAEPEPLPIGSADQVLTATPADADPVAWKDPDRIRQSLITDVGQLIVGLGFQLPGILEAGTDGQVLTADSRSPFGMRWT